MIPLHDDNPTRHLPLITIALIALCGLVYLWQLAGGESEAARQAYRFGLIPAVLLGEKTLPVGLNPVAPEWTMLTSMFLHGGLLHLGGNMLYLWIFGNNVEDALGPLRFTLFYLLAGVVAALAQTLSEPHSTIPMIGASGAISGVLGAYLVLHPRANVLVLIWLGVFSQLVRVPAFVVLGFYAALQVVNATLAQAGEGGVAWFAHLGGFLAGLLLIKPFCLGRPPPLGQRRGPWG